MKREDFKRDVVFKYAGALNIGYLFVLRNTGGTMQRVYCHYGSLGAVASRSGDDQGRVTVRADGSGFTLTNAVLGKLIDTDFDFDEFEVVKPGKK